jgi:hypothetical protein
MEIRSVVVVTALGFASFAHGQQAVQWRVEDGGNGHWYRLKTTSAGITWTQASLEAQGSGAHLATLTSEPEQSFVAGYLLSIPGHGESAVRRWGPWIGARQFPTPRSPEPHGGWTWVTEEEWSFEYWWSGQPDNQCSETGHEENFLSVGGWFVGGGGRWNDLPEIGCDNDPVVSALLEWSADCNGDGIVDYGQILAGDLDDADGNGIPDACEIPAGEFLITDSADDFSSVQGANGWRYEFDRGISTVVQPMPHFVTPAFSGGSAWSTRPTFGWPSGSYCAIGATECATSTPYSCSSYYAGLERSRRRWTGEAPVHGSLALFGRFFNHAGTVARLDVLLDGVLAYSISASTSDTLSDPTVIGVILPLEGVTSIELVADPLDSSCHSDTIRCTARIFGADCNGDGIVDYGQILDGTFEDVNSNGVPDTCEIDPCPGDITENGFVDGVDLSLVLSLWGTNGQKFPRSDTNDDGIVDANDLAVVLSGWGKCP